MILSVSRRTDIPRWYSEWLLRRLRAGEVLVRNPYRPGQLRRVPLSPAVVDAIVFWTKDPAPLLPWLDELDGMGYRYLFQFTLTPYGPEIEPGLRDKRAIVETFQVLGCRLGRGRVLWRYDPILFTDAIGLAWHEARFRKLCKALSPFTDQVTVSFLDPYPGRPMGGLRPPNALEMQELAAMLGQTAKEYHLSIVACCEAGDFSPTASAGPPVLTGPGWSACAAGRCGWAPTGASGPAAAAVKAWTSAPTTPVLPAAATAMPTAPPPAQRHGGRSTPPTAPY